ncbi:sodium:solute symporter family transporter [Aureivirga marina]|uniref:sodium:solute symporter family transporter n=1 Tax=Aureivirga marina TaxID=1182451 RepID=UPI0018CBBB64|nr:hypothetical protein [Aureivirga marina]
MHWIDWTLMILISIVILGQGIWLTWKENQKNKSKKKYSLKKINISVLAAQFTITSLIFIPSHAYHVGMGFIQYYFGIPIAIVIVCLIFVPIYNRYFYKYNIQTAYGFLEKRFDDKTRVLVSILFLIQKGLATGMIIIAPAIIIASILDVNLYWTNVIIGSIVILFIIFINMNAIVTMKKYQMYSIITLMIVTFIILILKLPSHVSVKDAIDLAGYSDKINLINYNLDFKSKYNIWTAFFGSSILFLSTYSSNQGNVSSYLSDTPVRFIRWKLVMKAITKIPVMFLILSIAAMLYVFYIFNQAPLHFNRSNVNQIEHSPYKEKYNALKTKLSSVFSEKKAAALMLLEEKEMRDIYDDGKNSLREIEKKEDQIRDEGRQLIADYAEKYNLNMKKRDKDYVFVSFIRDYLPIGLVGIVLGMLFFASIFLVLLSINNLAKTTMHDIYFHFSKKELKDEKYIQLEKIFKYIWLVLGIIFATFVTSFANLIEALIIIASLFYGTAFGLFTLGFFFKYIKQNAAFWGFLISELCVITLFFLERLHIIKLSFLWLNLFGCVLVYFFSFILQWFFNGFRFKSNNKIKLH